jgi:hypothetical protein
MPPTIHGVIGSAYIFPWSFLCLIIIYVFHFTFMLVLIVIDMTWYELKSFTNKYL